MFNKLGKMDKKILLLSIVILLALAVTIKSDLISIGGAADTKNSTIGNNLINITYRAIGGDESICGIKYTPECLTSCDLPIQLKYDGTLTSDSITFNDSSLKQELLTSKGDNNIINYYVQYLNVYTENVTFKDEICDKEVIDKNNTIKNCVSFLNWKVVDKCSWDKLPSKLSLNKTSVNYINFHLDKKADINGFKTDTIPSVNILGNVYNLADLAWWNSTWTVKKPIIIQEKSGKAQTNYQVRLNVTFDNNMNSSWQDLRFLNSSETGELYYYLWNTTSQYAQIDVKGNWSGNTTIYMYYGNPNVSTTSNGKNTYIWFEDFETGIINETPHGWFNRTGDGPIVINNSVGRAYDGTQYLDLNDKALGSRTGGNKTNENYTQGKYMVWYKTITQLFTTNTTSFVVVNNTFDNENGEYCFSQNMSNIFTYTEFQAEWNSTKYRYTYNGINESFASLELSGADACGAFFVASGASNQIHNVFDSFALANWTFPEPVAFFGNEQSANVSVNLNFPENNANKSIPFLFNCTVSASGNIDNVSLYGNWTGNWHRNSTNTSGIQTPTIFNIAIVDGNYIWNCEGVSGSEISLNNTNRTINVDSTIPNVTINSPSGTLTSKTFNINTTITDNLVGLQTCSYNITRGASTEIATTSLNCSQANDTVTVSSDATYVLFVSGKDYSGNENVTNQTFIVDTSTGQTPTSGSGGGGGGTTVIVSSGGEALWSMETDTKSDKYNLLMSSGDIRTKGLIFENLGDESREIKLFCENVNGDLCKYVTFEKTTFTLPLAKEVKTNIKFTITLPKGVEKKLYLFNIIAIDDEERKGVLSVEVNVGLFGLGSKILNRLTSSTNFLGIKSFPYFLIYILLIIVMFTFTYFTINKPFFKKKGRALNIIFSVVASAIIIAFI